MLEPGCSQEPGTFPGILTWVQGPRVEPSSTALPAESWEVDQPGLEPAPL